MASNPTPSADLAAALAGRVLHDLAGQASGMVAAFDLLADPGAIGMREEALALAEQSARKLARSLTLQRAVLGRGEPMARSALEMAAREVFADSRSILEVRISEAEPDPVAARVLLGLLQVVAGSSSGGVVSASLGGEAGESRVLVEARGPRSRLRDEEARGLSGDGPGDGQPHRWALAFWLARLVKESGGALRIHADTAGFTIEASVARESK